MGFVLISKSSTKLAGIEVVALRNLDTANKMYAGNIHCEPDQYSCQSRKSIGMHRYRSVLDSFSTLQATTQGVCRMEAPPTPVNVLMANSEAGRKLEDPKGWLEEGYMTNNHRLTSGRNTIKKKRKIWVRGPLDLHMGLLTQSWKRCFRGLPPPSLEH